MPVITENPKHKRHEITDDRSINMTPMIDVVFQLILFFMLTSSLVRPNQIELDLPESSSGTKAKSEEVVEVGYRLHEGKEEIKLNGQPMESLAQLQEALKLVAQSAREQGAKQPPVELKVDKAVPIQNGVDLIDTVRGAGFTKFGLQTGARGSQVAKPLSAAAIGGEAGGGEGEATAGPGVSGAAGGSH